MSIATFSPAFVLLFAWALLCILMDVHYQAFTPVQKWSIPLIFVVLAAFNHILRVQIGSPAYGKMILLTLHLPTFLVFRQITKCSVIKMIFMILSALVFTAPAIIISNIIRDNFHAGSEALFFANLATYTVMLLLAYFVFSKSFHYILKYGEDRTFLPLSGVPFLYYIYAFAVQNIDLSVFHSVSGYFVRHMPTLYIFLFYFLLFHNYRELSEKRELDTAQVALAQKFEAAQEQILLLHQAQTQTAVYQHDMRHHLNAIKGFLDAEKSEQAKMYIQKVQVDVDAITPKRFCENEIVNLLCSSFSSKAERLGISLKMKARLPNQLSLSDTDLCSILSNGLENALHAVEALEQEKKWISFYCEVKQNKFLLEIKNPYSGKIVMQDSLPVSIRQGHGYGCRSICTIVERHRGLCSFEPKDGIFTFRMVLPESQKNPAGKQ